jgi:hypothetical protein
VFDSQRIPWEARALLSAGIYTPGNKPSTLREAVELFLEMPEPVRALATLMCAEPIDGRQFLLYEEIRALADFLRN